MTNVPQLSFIPIDLERHADECVAFRRDAFVSSFGTVDGFAEENGQDGAQYIVWLRERVSEFPEGCVHVWSGNTIVGQLEMRIRDEPAIGYINLFYLLPAARGGGAGDQLHNYALRFFRNLGMTIIQLSVSPTNQRALAYYRKHGWQDLGPRAEGSPVHLMQLALASGTTS